MFKWLKLKKVKKNSYGLKRIDALSAVPIKAPVVCIEDISENEQKITLEFEFPRVFRFFLFKMPERYKRSFILDELGKEVYGYCDGSRTVYDIIRIFAEKHKISLVEAEYSVTTFLRVLTHKGLIVMVMRKKNERDCIQKPSEVSSC